MIVWFDPFIADLHSLLKEAGWLLVLTTVVVFVDLRFGVRASKVRGQAVRLSSALRRTFTKLVDYWCWVLLAIVLGRALGVPLSIGVLPTVVMVYAVAIELDSIGSHWAEIHGVTMRDKRGRPVSFTRYIVLLLTGNTSEALNSLKKNKDETEE